VEKNTAASLTAVPNGAIFRAPAPVSSPASLLRVRVAPLEILGLNYTSAEKNTAASLTAVPNGAVFRVPAPVSSLASLRRVRVASLEPIFEPKTETFLLYHHT